MRTAGLVAALGGLLNVAFANVVCNTEAVHSKPRIVSAAEENSFAKSIKEVCSTTDGFSDSRSGSTVFTVTGIDKNLGSDDCESQLHSIIEKCVAGHNFGGGRIITTEGLTLEVSTTTTSHDLEARRLRGGRSRTGRTRTRRPKKTRKHKTKKTRKHKAKAKKPAKQPTSCPIPQRKTGIKRFIPGFLLKRSGCDEVKTTLAFDSLARVFPDARDGEFYKFTSQSPFTGPSTYETDDEITALRRQLGFDHISVVVGKVIITTKTIGKGKNARRKISKDFQAVQIDLVKTKEGGAMYHDKAFAPKKEFELRHGARTTQARFNSAKTRGKAYFDDPAHKRYSVASNNCNTFVTALMREI